MIHEGMIFHNGRLFQGLLEASWFEAHTEEFGHVLEGALLVCGTVRAIHIMNGEQKPKSASLQISYCGGAGLDNQRREDPDGAGRNRVPVDFNKAEPAGSLRVPHAFKITEVRDINAVTQAGFEQDGSRWDFYFLIIH